MTNWRLANGGTRIVTAGGDPSDSSGLTGGVSLGSESSWTELVASMPFTAEWFCLTALANQSTVQTVVVDVALGAAGAEIEIVTDLILPCHSTSFGWNVPLPIRLPAGQRVSVRHKAASGSTLEYQITYGAGGFGLARSYSRLLTIGISGYNGTNLGDGGSYTANTKKAWKQLTAGLAVNIDGLLAVFTTTASVTGADRCLFDIGVGPGGSEQVILGNLISQTEGVAKVAFPPMHGPFPISIAAGTRIAARHQINVDGASNARGDRHLALYGLVA